MKIYVAILPPKKGGKIINSDKLLNEIFNVNAVPNPDGILF